jgi:hypothetical protein
MRLRGLADQRVARRLVDEQVEVDVGLDRRRHVVAGGGAASDIEQQPAAVGEVARVVCGGEPRRSAVERGAHHVEVTHLLHVERCNLHALAAGLDQEALPPQEHHGLQDRLATDAEFLRQLLLGEPGAGFQLARADGFEDGVVDSFAEIGFGKEGSHGEFVYRTPSRRSQRISGF